MEELKPPVGNAGFTRKSLSNFEVITPSRLDVTNDKSYNRKTPYNTPGVTQDDDEIEEKAKKKSNSTFRPLYPQTERVNKSSFYAQPLYSTPNDKKTKQSSFSPQPEGFGRQSQAQQQQQIQQQRRRRSMGTTPSYLSETPPPPSTTAFFAPHSAFNPRKRKSPQQSFLNEESAISRTNFEPSMIRRKEREMIDEENEYEEEDLLENLNAVQHAETLIDEFLNYDERFPDLWELLESGVKRDYSTQPLFYQKIYQQFQKRF